MKRVVIILVAVLMAAACFAQTVDTVHYLDEGTLSWEAVTTDADGEPLLATDDVTYDVYMYNAAESIDDQVVANLISVGGTSDTEMVLDFTGLPRAMYYAGVRVVVTDAQGAVTTSAIAWSYDPVATDPIQPFAYIPLSGVLILSPPTGLSEAGM